MAVAVDKNDELTETATCTAREEQEGRRTYTKDVP